MKRSASYVIGFGALLFICNCMDSLTLTKIDVLNRSSYNLRINFEVTNKPSAYKELDIRKNESDLIVLKIWGTARNPNDEVEKIIFSNLDTEEVIKEMITDKNVFEKTGEHKRKNEFYYLFEITNDLLFQNPD